MQVRVQNAQATQTVVFPHETYVSDGLGSVSYRVLKRVMDVWFALIALPIIGGLAVVLFCLNPFLNPGPIFFRQARMGRNGRPFMVTKFRTMIADPAGLRAHDAPLEKHRITPLGAVLRRFRIDELPNFLNVLAGDMSLIGPRPDAFDHARIYAATIPRYRLRYRAKPGITGLAQVRAGYADTKRAVYRKARYDSFYVCNPTIALELLIFLETFRVIRDGFGAK